MGNIASHSWAKLALLGLCELCINSALAAPPVVQRAAHWDARPTPDLRSALDMHTLAATMILAEKAPETFPSFPRRQSLGGQPQEHDESPAFGGLAPTRMESPLQALARRVHHEGVPVARLWENKSALVSLGLNQKGKPGLWIIQKTH